MLLFFINQITAEPVYNCNAKSDIIIKDNIEIVACDSSLKSHISYGVKYWQQKGYSISIKEHDEKDCSSLNEKNTIYVKIDNYKASQKDSKNYTYQAVTETTKGVTSKNFYHSVIFLKDTYTEEKPYELITHEIGHSLGFGHVDNECTGYLMNKNMSEMGLNF